jgi:hypothetical protein
MPVLNVSDGVNVNVAVQQGQTFSVTVNKGSLNGGLPGGNAGTLQYNANGVFGGVPTTSYSGNILNLGSNTNISIGGGTTGQALLTNGSGNLYWADISTANTANYANFANIANTANVALTVVGDDTILFNYGDATPKTLVTVPADTIVTSVTIIIVTPFDDPTATLTVGDAANTARLMTASDSIANSTGIYTVEPVYNYTTSTQLTLSISPGTSTVGNGLVILNYKGN